MRAVISSDWHPDFYMMGVSRFKEVKRAVTQSIDCAIDEKADVYLFLGDLADPDAGGETFRAIAMMQSAVLRLAKAKIQIILIAGNHDICTDGTGATTLTPLRALEKEFPTYISVVEEPKAITLENLTCDPHTFLCLPYTAPSHPYDPAAFATGIMESAEHPVIVLSHLMVEGIHPGSESKDMPRGRDIVFPVKETTNAKMRLQGHFHRRQMFDPGDGGPDIIIPGSLCRLAFGEEDNDPSFLIVEM